MLPSLHPLFPAGGGDEGGGQVHRPAAEQPHLPDTHARIPRQAQVLLANVVLGPGQREHQERRAGLPRQEQQVELT